MHRLRVSSRRSRAALALFRDLLPGKVGRWIGKRLKRLQRASGDARDLDVLIARVAGGEGADKALLSGLRGHRKLAQGPLVNEYEKLRRQGRLDLRTTQLLEEIGPGNSSAAGRWAAAALHPVARSFVEALPDPGAETIDFPALHRLRIRGKRLRYALEGLAGALPRRPLERVYAGLVELQDLLGNLNDHAVANRLWRNWALEASDPTVARRMLALAEESLRTADDDTDRFRHSWSSQWRRSLLRRVATLVGEESL